MSTIFDLLFLSFATFAIVSGWYFARWFWFYANEGTDEIIDFIRGLFNKIKK